MNNPELEGLAAEAANVDQATKPPELQEPTIKPGATAEDVLQVSPDQIAATLPEARMVAAIVSKVVEDKWGVGISEKTREEGAQKIAPLLVKYDFDSPFLRRWKIEIDALMFFGATGYAIYKAREADKEAQKQKSGDTNGGE